jgi:hypothetical protein
LESHAPIVENIQNIDTYFCTGSWKNSPLFPYIYLIQKSINKSSGGSVKTSYTKQNKAPPKGRDSKQAQKGK